MYKGIESDEKYIENYLKIAEIILYGQTNIENKYEKAYEILNKCLERSERYYSWLEWDDSFSIKLFDLLSIASFYCGNKKDSLLFAFLAREANPQDQRLQDNVKIIQEKITNKELA